MAPKNNNWSPNPKSKGGSTNKPRKFKGPERGRNCQICNLNFPNLIALRRHQSGATQQLMIGVAPAQVHWASESEVPTRQERGALKGPEDVASKLVQM